MPYVSLSTMDFKKTGLYSIMMHGRETESTVINCSSSLNVFSDFTWILYDIVLGRLQVSYTSSMTFPVFNLILMNYPQCSYD
jgi:hypothetical protein